MSILERTIQRRKREHRRITHLKALLDLVVTTIWVPRQESLKDKTQALVLADRKEDSHV